MLVALRDTIVLGVVTNRDYLRTIVEHPAFIAGATHTEFLAEHLGGWRLPHRDGRDLAAVAAALALTTPVAPDGRSGRTGAPSPFATLGGWRTGGVST
jgi:acetyl/propionyl-CoA carboxylase alpha subunit